MLDIQIMKVSQKSSITLYGFSGKFTAKQGQGVALAELLTHAAEAMANVESCHLYVVSHDVQNPDIVCVFEAWDSKEAHDSALTIPAAKEIIAKARPLIDGKPEGQVLQIRGGHGLQDFFKKSI